MEPARAADPPGVRSVPDPLQMTAALFLVPAFICVVVLRPLGVAVYGGNAVCSVYAHRPDRTATDTWTDSADLAMVAVWVAYNAALIVEANFRLRYMTPAVAMAFVVLGTKLATRRLVYRSPARYAVHAVMHLSGIVGSVLLLLT